MNVCIHCSLQIYLQISDFYFFSLTKVMHSEIQKEKKNHQTCVFSTIIYSGPPLPVGDSSLHLYCMPENRTEHQNLHYCFWDLI